MKKLAIAAAAVIALGSMAPDVAEAKNGRKRAAIVAGVAGAVIGGLIVSQSRAHAAPAYGYGQSYGYPASGYRPAYAPNYGYSHSYQQPVEYRRVRRRYDDYTYERPVVTRKVIIEKRYVEKRYEPAYNGYDDDDYGW
ncbi:hypothetical protein [Microvirga pakistanensis]|uniref:hypothetical protein n=1 Tax=Microvirga pakistanensis TaxID=1682650 RepID=UPI00106C27F0|nr:hypothetical protein [Microvirga pakistanensis]